MIILGVDPGSVVTGYGVIEAKKSVSYITGGLIRTKGEFPERLECIYRNLDQIIKKYKVDTAVIEKVFMAKSFPSALKLGQAHGVALLAFSLNKVSIYDYTPLEVKKSVVGYGRADKEQVEKMVKLQLGLNIKQKSDFFDALAIALCHSFQCKWSNHVRVSER